MFPYTKPELCDLLVKQHYLPQVKNIWCYCQDDGFGELVDTLDLCLADGNRTVYMLQFLELIYLTDKPSLYSAH